MFFLELLGQLVGVQQMCGRDHDTPHIVMSHSRAYASAFVCQHREKGAQGEGRVCFLPRFHHAVGAVQDGVQAEGRQIDYSACRKRVQGLFGQAP